MRNNVKTQLHYVYIRHTQSKFTGLFHSDGEVHECHSVKYSKVISKCTKGEERTLTTPKGSSHNEKLVRALSSQTNAVSTVHSKNLEDRKR